MALTPTNMQFNSLFTPEWLASLNTLAAKEATPQVTVPYQVGVQPLQNASALGKAWADSLPSVTGTGAAGTTDTSMAGALDRYTQSLGQMNTKDWINAGLGGVQTIGGLIGSFGSLNLANKQYNLQKRMLETNLTNQVTAYNTALEDKARQRAVVEGISDADTAAYIDKHKAVNG